MSGDTLRVDPAALAGAATAFNQAGTGLAELRAEGPLGEAAAAVPQLATASACRQAQSAIATDTASMAQAVTAFGANLDSAAGQYEAQDQAAAAAIDKCQIPGG